MDYNIFDMVFHIGDYLQSFAIQQSLICYMLVAGIIFLETGLVVTPFLPGDSLIFTVGALAATGVMQIEIILIIAGIAAIAGDTANYFIGRFFGKKLFRKEKSFLFNKKNLNKTEQFYERHGGKTIILARFIPVIRTFAPFVAGIGKMNYPQFLSYNVIGGMGWVLFLGLGGFYFGNVSVIKNNFSTVLVLIVLISIIPAVIAVIKSIYTNTKGHKTV